LTLYNHEIFSFDTLPIVDSSPALYFLLRHQL
jgi:hypothetical protein